MSIAMVAELITSPARQFYRWTTEYGPLFSLRKGRSLFVIIGEQQVNYNSIISILLLLTFSFVCLGCRGYNGERKRFVGG